MRWYVGNYQGYKFGRIGFVLHLGLPVPAFGLFLLVFNVLLCVCSFCFYFADAFGNAMWSDHRVAVPLVFLVDLVFYTTLQVLS